MGNDSEDSEEVGEIVTGCEEGCVGPFDQTEYDAFFVRPLPSFSISPALSYVVFVEWDEVLIGLSVERWKEK